MTSPRGAGRLGTEVRALGRGTRRLLAGRDVSSAAATLTYFSAIALVPWLLLALWSTTWTRGVGDARARLLELRVLVPPQMGARAPYDALVDAAVHLGVVGALIVLLPASFYGEGVRRACLALRPDHDHLTGWRSRLVVMALLLPLPALAWTVLAVGDRLAPLSPDGGGGGAGALVVRVLAGFTVVWLALSVLLTWVFRAVAPGRPRWAVAALGALATGSFLAGFLHGFQLFLAIPVDVGIPYGGLGYIGGVVAVGLWLYVLHVCVLLGWAVTAALDEQVAGWSGSPA